MTNDQFLTKTTKTTKITKISIRLWFNDEQPFLPLGVIT